MCGIFGINHDLPEHQRTAVCRALFHRGPDARRFATADDWTFFHSRLAIIDLEGGNQPLETARCSLVFNGEIYNYRDLVRQFGLQPHTNSDTEVIALLYEELETDVFRHLNGMFAIALYDRVHQHLILARDRSGKKPLYWGANEHFVFASEIKALFAAGIPVIPSKSNILTQMRIGFVPGTSTVYENVHEIDPGSYAIVDNGGQILKQTRFWVLPDRTDDTPDPITSDQAFGEFERCLFAAVERRVLSSDIEVGAFLSSGVDSSLICAMAKKVNPNIRTFTIATGGSGDESSAASAIARKLEISNEVLELDTMRLRDEYDKILLAYDEPILDESIIPTYYVCRAAKERVTVVLTGDGGDEIMGGYRRHWVYQNMRGLLNLKSLLSVGASIQKWTGNEISRRGMLSRLSRVIGLPANRRYWAATTDLFFDAPSPLSDDFGLPHYDLLGPDPLRTGMRADFGGILPKILLKKVDIAAMQHALEPRAPLLDVNVIEMAMRLPAKMKIRGRQTKWLLRQIMKKWVGAEFAKLPKRGFEVDVRDLLENTLQQSLRDLVYGPNPFFSEIIDYQFVKKNYLNAGAIEPARRYKGLLALLNLEIWHNSLSARTAN